MQASEYEMGAPNIRAKGIVFGTSKEFLHINEKDIKSNRKYENVMVCSYSPIPEEGKVRYVVPLSIKFIYVNRNLYLSLKMMAY